MFFQILHKYYTAINAEYDLGRVPVISELCILLTNNFLRKELWELAIVDFFLVHAAGLSPLYILQYFMSYSPGTSMYQV